MNEKIHGSSRESVCSTLETDMPDRTEHSIGSAQTPSYLGLKGGLIARGVESNDYKRVLVWGWTERDY